MIDHRNLQQVLRPFDGVGIGALAGEEQRAEFRQIVFADELAFRVFLLDRAEGGRRGEQRDRAVLGDHAPERAGIRRADRLALVKDRGAAVKQRRIDDVGMPDHPADIGRAPIHFARLDAVEIFHRPFQRDHVAAMVAHHAFRNAGRARGVENVERIGREHRHAIGGLLVLHRFRAQRRPVVIAAGDHRGFAPAGVAGSCRPAACRSQA